MLKKLDAALFDVPFTNVEVPDGGATPWASNTVTERKFDEKLKPVSECKPSETKVRKRYSQKLAKQLQAIGVEVDMESGKEKKNDKQESASNLYENLANETLEALNGSAYGMNAAANDATANDAADDCDSDESLSTWDPMKTAYENKTFNTYQNTNYNSNFRQKHSPIRGLDGKSKISPAKLSSEHVKLFVGNIPMSLTEEGLINMFSSVGKCFDVRKKRPREGDDNAYAFVSFESVRQAEAAIYKYNGYSFDKDGPKLRVNLARNAGSVSSEKLHWGGRDGRPSDGELWDTMENESTNSSSKEEGVGIIEYHDARVNKNESMSSLSNRSMTTRNPSTLRNKMNFQEQSNVREEQRIYQNEEHEAVKHKVCNVSGKNVEISSLINNEEIDKKISYTPLTTMKELNTKKSTLDSSMSADEKPSSAKEPTNMPRIYVQGIHVKTSEMELQDLFQQVGTTYSVQIIQPTKAKQFTTFGFISYATLEEAKEAVDKFSNHYLYGSPLRVELTDNTKRQHGLMPADEDENLFYDKLYGDEILNDSPSKGTPTTSDTIDNVVLNEDEKQTSTQTSKLSVCNDQEDVPKTEGLPLNKSDVKNKVKNEELCSTNVVMKNETDISELSRSDSDKTSSSTETSSPTIQVRKKGKLASICQILDTNQTISKLGSEEKKYSPSKSKVGSEEESCSPSLSKLGSEEESCSPSKSKLGSEEESCSPNMSKLGSQEKRYSPSKSKLGSEEKSDSPSKSKLGYEEESVSPIKSKLGSEEEKYSPNKSKLGPQEENYSPNKSRLAPEEENYSPSKSRLGPEEENYSPSKSRLGAEDENYSPNKTKIGSEEENYISSPKCDASSQISQNSGDTGDKDNVLHTMMDFMENISDKIVTMKKDHDVQLQRMTNEIKHLTDQSTSNSHNHNRKDSLVKAYMMGYYHGLGAKNSGGSTEGEIKEALIEFIQQGGFTGNLENDEEKYANICKRLKLRHF